MVEIFHVNHRFQAMLGLTWKSAITSHFVPFCLLTDVIPSSVDHCLLAGKEYNQINFQGQNDTSASESTLDGVALSNSIRHVTVSHKFLAQDSFICSLL